MTDTPNPNLKAALVGSLRLIESESEPQSGTDESPLREATVDSVDYFLDRINQKLIDGMPVPNQDLEQLANFYRAQALKWAQEEDIKKTKSQTKREKKFAPGEIMDI
jgi:hypothetical protein